MAIINYLLELIKSRKEIGIDGLGTFYKQKLPGRYDAATHQFLPPSYQLAFTQELKENTALISFFAKKTNVSEDTVSNIISDFVKEVNTVLTTHGSYDLQGLGKLILEKGNISFTPNETVNSGFEFYALPPVNSDLAVETTETVALANQAEDSTIEPKEQQKAVNEFAIETPAQPENDLESLAKPEEVKEEEIAVENQIDEQNPDSFVTEEIGHKDNEPELNPSVEEDEEPVFEEIAEAPTLVINEDKPIVPINSPTKDWNFSDAPKIVHEQKPEPKMAQYEEKKGMPAYLKFLLAAIILAVGLIILYLVNPSIFGAFVKNDTNPDQKIAIPLAESKPLNTQTDSLSLADSIRQNAEKVGLPTDSAKDTPKITVKAKPVIKKPSITYEVIVAALTKKDVPAFIARLKRKGIVARVETDIPGRLNKISIGSFNNPDSATKYAKQYQKTLKDPTIYSIPVKHK